jgi:hypothetical protein
MSRSRSSIKSAAAVGVLLAASLLSSGPVLALIVQGAGGSEEPEKKHEGFSVRKEDSKFNDALDDFTRYRDKKAWELAFRSLEILADGKREGMVPAGKGFFVPSRQRVLIGLTSLPPEGKQAFRLFYDAKAKQLLDQIDAAKSSTDPSAKPVDEVATLREIFDKYFISSVGDKAADRLGDALFESGDFASAATMWNALLKEFPDSAIPQLRLRVKRSVALARAGQWDLFDQSMRELRTEFAGEKLTLGGSEVVVTDYLEALRTAGTTSTAPATTGPYVATDPVTLPGDDKPAWQIKIMDESLARHFNGALNNNNWGSQWSGLRTLVPASTTDGQRVYVNWLGIVFAADVKTGTMVWRNRKFSEMNDKFQNFVNSMADTDCYSTTVIGDRLLVTGINVDRINNSQEPVRLVSMMASDGKVKWSSSTGALANWSFVGLPVAGGPGVVYATARQRNGTDISLLAIGADKGDLLWQVLLGTAQAGTNYRGESDMPRPVILTGNGALYVLTNNGALVAVDVAARRVQWAFTYDGPPISSQQTWWNGQVTISKPKMYASAAIDGSTLYLKEENGDGLYAVDLTGPSLLWRRPLDPDSSFLPLDKGRLLAIGQDLGAIDGKSRSLMWSASLPTLIGRVTPLVSGNRVLAFAPRGIYEIDATDGDTVRILRGADRDSYGGSVHAAPGRLICVSNLSVTAYPLAGGTEQAAK